MAISQAFIATCEFIVSTPHGHAVALGLASFHAKIFQLEGPKLEIY